MSIEFTEVELINPVQQAVQLTNENIEYFAESLNGQIDENGLMSFQISNHVHFCIAGDWLVLFDRGRDILKFSDKMYKRLFQNREV
jgi:hypothetical protein